MYCTWPVTRQYSGDRPGDHWKPADPGDSREEPGTQDHHQYVGQDNRKLTTYDIHKKRHWSFNDINKYLVWITNRQTDKKFDI